jgi:hypothetical protein
MVITSPGCPIDVGALSGSMPRGKSAENSRATVIRYIVFPNPSINCSRPILWTPRQNDFGIDKLTSGFPAG